MIQKIDHRYMGRCEQGWLTSWFHFSFAEYWDPDNVHFGALRVVNDDLIAPHAGFDSHPHKDMEILTYVVDGALTHKDSLQNNRTLWRGEVQYLSAGTGIQHSERNEADAPLRLLQIWIFPDSTGCEPRYQDFPFPWSARVNRLLHIASGENGCAPIKIRQDLNIYATELSAGNALELKLEEGRQAYIIIIEGEAELCGDLLRERDAAEILNEPIVRVNARTTTHLLLFEMAED